MFDEDSRFARLDGEKKIVSLPPVRVTEGLRSDLQALANIQGVTEADLVRKAISKLIDEHIESYRALHSIFAGRERLDNQSLAAQCNALGADGEGA